MMLLDGYRKWERKIAGSPSCPSWFRIDTTNRGYRQREPVLHSVPDFAKFFYSLRKHELFGADINWESLTNILYWVNQTEGEQFWLKACEGELHYDVVVPRLLGKYYLHTGEEFTWETYTRYDEEILLRS